MQRSYNAVFFLSWEVLETLATYNKYTTVLTFFVILSNLDQRLRKTATAADETGITQHVKLTELRLFHQRLTKLISWCKDIFIEFFWLSVYQPVYHLTKMPVEQKCVRFGSIQTTTTLFLLIIYTSTNSWRGYGFIAVCLTRDFTFIFRHSSNALVVSQHHSEYLWVCLCVFIYDNWQSGLSNSGLTNTLNDPNFNPCPFLRLLFEDYQLDFCRVKLQAWNWCKVCYHNTSLMSTTNHNVCIVVFPFCLSDEWSPLLVHRSSLNLVDRWVYLHLDSQMNSWLQLAR